MNPKVIFSFVKKNAPSVLSWMAVGGVTLTGFLMHKAGRRYNPDEPFKKQVKNYIPGLIAGAGTVACIVGANCAHLKIEHAMAGAIAFYKAASEDYEQYGEEVYKEFGDGGIPKNVISEDKLKWDNVQIKVWEPYTKQYFETTRQELLWAELEANKLLSSKGTVKLNDVLALYKNCKPKPIGEELGWSWDEDWFCECASYYWHGGWIDLCPQWEDHNGEHRFILEYGINPMEISL